MAAEVEDMVRDHEAGRPWHAADLGFHLAIARATGNAALAGVVERLWQEQHAPVFALLSERMCSAKTGPRRSVAIGRSSMRSAAESGRPRGTECGHICSRCWR